MDEDPAGPAAQALATRWVHLLEDLMGGPVPPSLRGHAAASDAATVARMQALADKRVWDFMSQALTARP